MKLNEVRRQAEVDSRVPRRLRPGPESKETEMKKPSGDLWFAYILRCADGSLYTGITKDVSRRCQQHNAGTASRYTRSRLPVEVVYQEAHASRSLALRREAAIKAMTKRQKLALIRLAACSRWPVSIT